MALTLPKMLSQSAIDQILSTHSDWIAKATSHQQSQINRAKDLYRSNAPMLPLLGEWVAIDANIEQFYRKKAREFFEAASKRIALDLNATYKKITIKDQKTRYGSYSSSGTLSYNWRVIKAPKNVAFYLAAHECAHIIHHNHSARFWQTVASLAPDFEASKAWLKQNQQFLWFDPWR